MSDKIEAKSTTPAAATESHSSFIDDVMQHTGRTWSNVTSGNASAAEYLEAGAEVALTVGALAAAKRFSGISRVVTTEATLGTELLATSGIPITASSRASMLGHGLLSPAMRGAAVKAELELVGLGTLGGEASLFSSGVPISEATRKLALTPAIGDLSVSMRAAEMARTTSLLTEHGLPITQANRAAIDAIRTSAVPINPVTRDLMLRPGVTGLPINMRAGAIGSELAATDALVGAGIPINPATRGAAMNPLIESLHPGLRAPAITAEVTAVEALIGSSTPINPATRRVVESIPMDKLRPYLRPEALHILP